MIYIQGHYQHQDYILEGMIEMYVKGTHVRLRTGDSWDNLVGIIDEVQGDIIIVFCTLMPISRYFVNIYDAEKVLELV